MNELQQANPARSLQSPESLASSGSKAAREARQSAEEMEALFLQFLMATMRKSVERSELMPETPGNRLFRGMLDEEYCRLASESGRGLGLADLIESQWSAKPGGKNGRF
ncbi:MAG: rod-binding protein [Candidatus Krumholzibacteria bacterium]|jgi:Rod binding domain-containing protein|nr:rod-binding protein [Candidatus Krumholzibacteria bacterium]MDP6669037.1 rod-binding protein [Candidatus Krumholzibacteria bacterium]MDP6797461.1 rod-binding protein [Candidatus Krumholzibacteria bacterium]MDP7020976.1 rod-binding protein [Candidatus Krumholzibacteria bacterium]